MLSDLIRAPANLAPGVGDRAPYRPPAADAVLGVLGWRRPDRPALGVFARRTGLSGRCSDGLEPGVRPYMRLLGDSERCLAGVRDGGWRADKPVGELSVGVGGA